MEFNSGFKGLITHHPVHEENTFHHPVHEENTFHHPVHEENTFRISSPRA